LLNDPEPDYGNNRIPCGGSFQRIFNPRSLKKKLQCVNNGAWWVWHMGNMAGSLGYKKFGFEVAFFPT